MSKVRVLIHTTIKCNIISPSALPVVDIILVFIFGCVKISGLFIHVACKIDTLYYTININQTMYFFFCCLYFDLLYYRLFACLESLENVYLKINAISKSGNENHEISLILVLLIFCCCDNNRYIIVMSFRITQVPHSLIKDTCSKKEVHVFLKLQIESCNVVIHLEVVCCGSRILEIPIEKTIGKNNKTQCCLRGALTVVSWCFVQIERSLSHKKRQMLPQSCLNA